MVCWSILFPLLITIFFYIMLLNFFTTLLFHARLLVVPSIIFFTFHILLSFAWHVHNITILWTCYAEDHPIRIYWLLIDWVMSINIYSHLNRGRHKNRIGCVKDDMRIKGVSMEMTSDRKVWKEKTCCADSTSWKETMMIMMIKLSFIWRPWR
jgi:hypothetical protein